MHLNYHYNPNRHGRYCAYCHDEMTIETATIDHVIPISKGGYGRDDNWLWACSGCNGLKADMSLEEFRQVLSRKTGNVMFAFESSSLVADKIPTYETTHRLRTPIRGLVNLAV